MLTKQEDVKCESKFPMNLNFLEKKKRKRKEA